jgi:hypothetical protein
MVCVSTGVFAADKPDLPAADAAPAPASADSDSPYAGIVARNMFGLVPIPVATPEDAQPPADPPPKITPTGIMTIFGRDQALFKASPKPKPGQQPKEVAYVLAVGERQDDIEVTKIDHTAGVITFNNHGVTQELPLVPPTETGGAPGVGGGGGGPAIPLPGGRGPGRQNFEPRSLARQGMVSSGSAAGNPGYGGQASLNPSAFNGGGSSGVANGGATGLNFGSEVNEHGIYQPKDDGLTPEQSVILQEAQRMQYMQANDPRALLIPPTPLTQQNVQEHLQHVNGGAPPP